MAKQKTPACPPCPMCGHNKNSVWQGDQPFCKKHMMPYDDDPNEGSDVHADPSRRMEIQEADAEYRRKMKGRRR